MTPTALDGIKALAVQLEGRRIGVISRLVGDRQLFAFEQDHVDDANRPVLSLSFKGQGGGLVTTPRTYATRVPPFFSNLLPEGHLRDYLAARAGVRKEREFFLLAALGADLPGGVVVTPLSEDGVGPEPTRAGAKPKSQRAAQPVLRFSLAGVQLKFSAILEAAGGLTIPADGMGGSWIVKLPSERFPTVPENEFVMLELARRLGIAVPEIRLVEIADIAGLPAEVARLKG